MKILKVLFVLLTITVMVFGVNYAKAEETKTKALSYKTAQELFKICEDALNGNAFEQSYCSGYLEGFLGGRSVSLLFA